MRAILKEILRLEKEDVLAYTWGWLVASALLLFVLGILSLIEKFYAGGILLCVFAIAQLIFAKKYREEVSKINLYGEEVEK